MSHVRTHTVIDVTSIYQMAMFVTFYITSHRIHATITIPCAVIVEAAAAAKGNVLFTIPRYQTFDFIKWTCFSYADLHVKCT